MGCTVIRTWPPLSTAARSFLCFVADTGGGWLPTDPVKPPVRTVDALVSRGYLRWFLLRGQREGLSITPLGTAAARWGCGARVVLGGKAV